MSKIDNWLKENHKEIYDEYLSSLDNKRERERVILKTLDSKICFKYLVSNRKSQYINISKVYGNYGDWKSSVINLENNTGDQNYNFFMAYSTENISLDLHWSFLGGEKKTTYIRTG